MEDIILFYKLTFHLSGLQPVSDQLNKLGIPHTLTGKRHLIYDHFNDTKKKFKLLVLADEWNLFKDCAEEVMTISHSMAGKNTTFSPRNNDIDYICVPSMYYKGEYLRRGVKPKKDFFITGYSPADKIFNKIWDRESWWNKDRLKKEIIQKNILFAPTYNRDLSLVDELIRSEKENKFFERLFSNPMKKYRVAFKSHPVLNKKYPDQIEQIKRIAAKYPDKFYFHEDSHSDISSAILWSDVVIGDSSGAILLGVAGDRSIIAYDNPNRERSEYFDISAPEWSLRDVFATRISSMDDTFPSLIESVLNEDPLYDSRIQMRNLLYGEFQGNSAYQIASRIKELYDR